MYKVGDIVVVVQDNLFLKGTHRAEIISEGDTHSTYNYELKVDANTYLYVFSDEIRPLTKLEKALA